MKKDTSDFVVTFWGVRGSIPTSLSNIFLEKKIRAAMTHLLEQPFSKGVGDLDQQVDGAVRALPSSLRRTVGGNTSCVSLQAGDQTIIFDAGTGIRLCGEELMQSEPFRNGKGICHLFFSHLHWDHLQGLPFFPPLYVDGNEIHLYGVHKEYDTYIREQQKAPYFPVPFERLKSKIAFHSLEPDQKLSLGGLRIQNHRMSHPGGCYAYRVEQGGRSFIYATDSDFLFYKPDSYPAQENFFSQADLLVFDAQFTLTDAFKKYDYGHSHAKKGVEMAVREGIRRIVLFHHDPTYNDEQIDQVLRDAIQYRKITFPSSELEILIGMEGLSIHL